MRKIIIWEEDREECDTLTALLEDEYRVTAVCDEGSVRSALRVDPRDVIVLGVAGFTEGKCLRVLRRLRALAPDTPILCRLPHGDPGIHTSLLRQGASACVSRSCSKEELKAWLREIRAVPLSRLTVSEAPPAFPDQAGVHILLGESKAIRQIRAQIELVAKYDFPVLLTGESGTGKELAARSIHSFSARASGPFLAVNCGALPDTMLESELFGAEKGAYTDALSRPGQFELADRGTLFLDEVTELSPGAQAKLLRILEDGEVRRLGSRRTLRCDVRLISATNADLDTKNGFRYDLLERLETLVVEMPPLRARPEDIPILCRHFLERAGMASAPDDGALAVLSEYDWPGNIRQLKNTILRAAVAAIGSGAVKPAAIRREHILFGRRPPEN